MTKLKYIFLFVMLAAFSASVEAKMPPIDYNYELTREGLPAPRDANFVICWVYSYGKRADITTEVCKRNAIHGIIFKGLPSTNLGGAVPALIKNGSYDEYADYFDRFFKGGDYMQYIEETNKGFQDVMKLSSKEYKVGITVKVRVNDLRKRLMKDGIIKDYYDLMR